MKIWVIDDKTRDLVLSMVDIALRGGGIQNLSACNLVLAKLSDEQGRELEQPKPVDAKPVEVDRIVEVPCGDGHCAGAIR